MRPYAEALAAALRTEFGDTRSAAKTVMRCTGAGERTVKTWLGGVSGPNGEHLIRLICHSDVVFALVLARSGRARADVWGRQREGAAPHPPGTRGTPGCNKWCGHAGGRRTYL